jgi:nicotine blue oxidoreductase
LEKVNPRRAVITLVDLPGLTPAAINHICDAPGDLLAATYDGIQGHPVLIGDYHWKALIAELDGDSGARHYLRQHGVSLISLDQFANGDDLDYPLK